MFFKDDWKVRPSFTLNLGVRYEFYGAPYEHRGLNADSGRRRHCDAGSFRPKLRSWLRPNNPVDMNKSDADRTGRAKQSQSQPRTLQNDWNNFGPAVGFSWQLPWLGKGKTNIRGGYQITYAKPRNLANLVNGSIFEPRLQQPCSDPPGRWMAAYFDLRNLRPSSRLRRDGSRCNRFR